MGTHDSSLGARMSFLSRKGIAVAVTRRSLLLAGATTPAAVALAGGASAQASSRPRTSPDRTVELRDGWRFALVNPAGITDPSGAYDHAAAHS